MKKVLIIMGSDSDYEVVKGAISILKDFDIETKVRVCSAHRTPDVASELAKNAKKDGVGVIIAAAGKAAHLPGVIAAHTPLAVIGLPIKSSFMDGMDSLLSIVQMPSGVPVASVGVNGAKNAGLLAVQILANGDEKLFDMLDAYKADMAKAVKEKDNKIQKILEENK